jgi:hypothetical protein
LASVGKDGGWKYIDKRGVEYWEDWRKYKLNNKLYEYKNALKNGITVINEDNLTTIIWTII